MRPRLHERSPLFERVAPPVGPLRRVADDVGEPASATSPGKRVSFPAQSRKADQKPCTVTSSRFMRRRTISIANAALSTLPEALGQSVDPSLGIHEPGDELCRIDGDHCGTTTDEVVICLKPSDRLRGLLATTWTGNSDHEIVVPALPFLGSQPPAGEGVELGRYRVLDTR